MDETPKQIRACDLNLKDFPNRTAYMREYQYLYKENKVAYRRGRYNKQKKVISEDCNLD